MVPRVGRARVRTIIPERAVVGHDCPEDGTACRPAPAPFERPPRATKRLTCRGCFNRCALRPGEPGVCGVKRNIAGRITHARPRVKGIVGGT